MKTQITFFISILMLAGCAGTTKPELCDGSNKKPINIARSTVHAPQVLIEKGGVVPTAQDFNFKPEITLPDVIELRGELELSATSPDTTQPPQKTRIYPVDVAINRPIPAKISSPPQTKIARSGEQGIKSERPKQAASRLVNPSAIVASIKEVATPKPINLAAIIAIRKESTPTNANAK